MKLSGIVKMLYSNEPQNRVIIHAIASKKNAEERKEKVFSQDKSLYLVHNCTIGIQRILMQINQNIFYLRHFLHSKLYDFIKCYQFFVYRKILSRSLVLLMHIHFIQPTKLIWSTIWKLIGRDERWCFSSLNFIRTTNSNDKVYLLAISRFQRCFRILFLCGISHKTHAEWYTKDFSHWIST